MGREAGCSDENKDETVVAALERRCSESGRGQMQLTHWNEAMDGLAASLRDQSNGVGVALCSGVAGVAGGGFYCNSRQTYLWDCASGLQANAVS